MPKYFQHIRDDATLLKDPEGEQLPDLDAVIRAAEEGARDVLMERLRQHQRADGRGSQIEVTDEDDTILAVVEFSDVVAGTR